MTLLSINRSLLQARRMVARVLLEYVVDNTTKCHQVSQRDIVILTGTDWEMVHESLKSLEVEKVIKFERHRIIINKVLLQKVAGATEHVQNVEE